MNSQCQNIRSLFDRFLDGDLQDSDASRLKKHLEECPACSSELQKDHDIITMFELLPELSCPEHVLRNIEAATLDQERAGFSIGRLKTAFSSFVFSRWRLVTVGAALAIVILMIARYPVTRESEPLPVEYSQEEAHRARKTAKWSVVYATEKLGTAGKKVIGETMRTQLPSTIKRSIQNVSLPVTGGK